MVAYIISEIKGVQGGYIDYTISIISGSDAVTTVDTGTFTSATGGFSGVVEIADTLIITSGNDAGSYVVLSVDSDTQLTVTPNFPNGDTAENFVIHREPAYIDDDFDGNYVYDGTIVYQTHISATKTGASIVIQGGDNITIVLVGASTL
jgi:hypothetical protein